MTHGYGDYMKVTIASELLQCLRCGALVMESATLLHDMFHERQHAQWDSG